MIDILKYNEERDYGYILASVIALQWQSFYEERKQEYQQALLNSQTYVVYDGKQYCGYVRGICDGTFTLFIAEIAIDEPYRRKGLGTKLIDYLQRQFPTTRIDLISDNDDFYIAQGFRVLGNGMRRSDWY